jgi:DNA polymerase-3 subunit delta'
MEGVGKATVALRFAMACNCRSAGDPAGGSPPEELPFCGACAACRKIGAGAHPDIHHVRPAGAAIRIDQVRGLCGQLVMKPYEAHHRFAIVSEAHTLNAEAANALLKVLEEPPDRTILILTAIQASDLLPTILSRCQPVRFHPIPRRVLSDHLQAREGLPPETATARAVLAGGSFSRAMDPNLAEWMPRRRWLIRQAETLSRASNAVLLAFAEKLARDKPRLGDAMEILKLWFRDLLIWRHDPERIVNADLLDRIGPAARLETPAAVLAKIESIQTAQRAIAGNANPRLVMEALVRRLADPKGEK